MNRYSVFLGNIVISETETESDTLSENDIYGAEGILIGSPDTLPEAVEVEVRIGGDWKTLIVDGAEPSIGAGEAVFIPNLGYEAIRLSSEAAAGDRTFTVRALYTQ